MRLKGFLGAEPWV
ncbi:hypothetical protein VN97_g5725, partial [Penicillium thymicola]